MTLIQLMTIITHLGVMQERVYTVSGKKEARVFSA